MSNDATSFSPLELTKAPASSPESRTVPQAPRVEKSVLSMMTIDPSYILGRCITKGMGEEYFYVPAHKLLWNIFLDRYNKNQPLDITSVAQELTDKHQLEAVGGLAGLTEIYSYTTNTALFDPHFETLQEKYVLRSIIATTSRSMEKAFAAEEEIAELLDSVEQDVLGIREKMKHGEEQSLSTVIAEAVTNMERFLAQKGGILGITTGFEKLDRMSNGLKAGELFVVAARPSMGKTSFLLNMMEHIALDLNKPSLIFSCEMPSVQLVERLIFARSGIRRAEMMARGSMTQQEQKHFARVVSVLRKSRLVLDDTAAISINELRAKARRVLRDQGELAAIGIDYLQLMRSHTKQAQNSREREIAEISSGLKSLAKELKVPIIVLAQLNRGPENRTGGSLGVPRMSDLRESGAIEQDADMIGLLYRSAYYAENDEERQQRAGHANLLLAKNRNGPTGDVPLYFEAELMRFSTRQDEEGSGE
ncbi:replicative DNA helicase [Akkermansia glycaniphila]|uniref:Replicative DNA helicase n=1 Tax=Akkermansia glycaniphila TaxID=1679444 RepID=A0A1C7PFN0_9BACT|nr:replicative DNA helicase [Akkermansia glycaniphila]MBT9449505.1 replicative DNA helicase [Akkermansia glycaniphila]OCA02401.1 helicase DnaB [Akkermansia glycaniphila]OCA04268.1 helicase DnaB [Akkermansia glycaniphila]SEH88748.1 dnab: replicative dna helicase [Akkermansia glycaniphila]